jgi:hypothetical protein
MPKSKIVSALPTLLLTMVAFGQVSWASVVNTGQLSPDGTTERLKAGDVSGPGRQKNRTGREAPETARLGRKGSAGT